MSAPNELELKAIDCIVNGYDECTVYLDQLEPSDFSHPTLAKIVELAKDIRLTGASVDIISIYSASGDNDEVWKILTDDIKKYHMFSYTLAEGIVDKIKRNAQKRRIAKQFKELFSSGLEDLVPGLEKIVAAEHGHMQPQESGRKRFDAYFERLSEPLSATRLETGFNRLDKLIGWLPLGSVSCIGARTSVGKTAFVVNIAVRQIKAGHRVMMASLEMSESQIYDRELSMVSGVSYQSISQHRMNTEETKTAREAKEIMQGWPGEFLVFDSLFDVNSILSRAAREGVEMLIIDFVQYLTGERAENRTKELNKIMMRLKQGARLYNVHIVILSQLSRETDSKERRPILSDLKDCGGIEEGSDIVIFLHRQGLVDQTVDKKQTEIIVAKNKYGKTGYIDAEFYGETQRFHEVYKP